MKRKYISTLLTSCAFLFLFPQSAHSMTLSEALNAALSSNPELLAARQGLEATKEQSDIAASGYRPTFGVSGTAGTAYNKTNLTNGETTAPFGANASVSQPLYTGGTTAANIKGADLSLEAETALVDTREQAVLFQTAKAYLDVLRYQSVIELNENNEKVLAEQLSAEQKKFELGDSTRTDTAQSESRLAASRANVHSAKARYNAAKAAFTRYVGKAPEDLKDTEIAPKLPQNRADAIKTALAEHSAVKSYRLAHEASLENVKSIDGENNPRLNLVGNAGYNTDPSVSIDDTTDASVKLQLNIPLYQAGSVQARKRQAMAQASRNSIEISRVEREISEAVDAAWSNFDAIQASVEARRVQVDASKVALDGVRAEEEIGSRTTLDVLNAEQENLDARVSLVEAEFDRKIAVLSLMNAMGKLKIELLGL